MPSSAATSVAALPLLSHSSTAWHLKALSNFFRVCLNWITGLLIRVYLLYVFFVPVSARSAQPHGVFFDREARFLPCLPASGDVAYAAEPLLFQNARCNARAIAAVAIHRRRLGLV